MHRIRGNLRVVAERESLIRLLHHSRLRIAGAYPCLPLGLFSALACLPLLQLFQRTLQPLLLLASRAGLGLLCLRTALVARGDRPSPPRAVAPAPDARESSPLGDNSWC